VNAILGHESPREQARLEDILRLVPTNRSTVLEIGTRDGFICSKLINIFEEVTALDLELPVLEHRRIKPVKGDVRDLQFEDNAFDVVLCAEVLEHIPPIDLPRACSEVLRVSRHEALIGVPYKQDLRSGKTTCGACGRVNPPWGHVNSFDEHQLVQLFQGMTSVRTSFVGEHNTRTNALSSSLMTLAGNPYGTYGQMEGCISCGTAIKSKDPSTTQKAVAKIALMVEQIQQVFTPACPIWMHVLFRKDNLAVSNPVDHPVRGAR